MVWDFLYQFDPQGMAARRLGISDFPHATEFAVLLQLQHRCWFFASYEEMEMHLPKFAEFMAAAGPVPEAGHVDVAGKEQYDRFANYMANTSNGPTEHSQSSSSDIPLKNVPESFEDGDISAIFKDAGLPESSEDVELLKSFEEQSHCKDVLNFDETESPEPSQKKHHGMPFCQICSSER